MPAAVRSPRRRAALPLPALLCALLLLASACVADVPLSVLPGARWACGAARRRGLRRSQEDHTLLVALHGTHHSCAPLTLVAVFDGHEGDAAASFAAEALPDAVSAALARNATACDHAAGSWRGGALAAALHDALANVDDRFVAAAAASSPPLRDGSTAVAALLPDGGAGVAVAHIGDSRALLCSALAFGAPPLELTAPHAPDVPAERARIEAAGGTVARGRLEGVLAVSRALGDVTYRGKGLVSASEAAWHPLPASADLALLLTSDGALERASPAQLCAAAAGDVTTQRALAAEGARRRRAALALGPTHGAPRLEPLAASLATARGGEEDDDSQSGHLAAAAAAAADSALASGSSDNVAVVRCVLGDAMSNRTSISDAGLESFVDKDIAPGGLLAGRWRLLRPALVLRGPERASEAASAARTPAGMSLAPWAAASRECAQLPPEWTRDGEHALPGRGFALALDDGAAHAACVRALLALPGPDEEAMGTIELEIDAAAAPETPPPLGGGRFLLGSSAGSGHFGQVWHARSSDDGDGAAYVLKRSLGPARDAAAREAHFGAQLRGAAGAARLVDAFTVSDGAAWLAFVDEGASIAALMYSDGGEPARASPPRSRSRAAAPPSGGVVLLQPSAWWRERRASEAGAAELKALLAGVLQALAEAHARGIAHRDVKPANILVDAATGRVRLCDWGSAVSAEALRAGLYGTQGPSPLEETREYAPPEAHAGLGGAAWAGRGAPGGDEGGMEAQMAALYSYDVWSAAVLGLELLTLATPDVFAPPPRAAAAAARAAAAAGLGSAARDALTHLRGLAALCVAQPRAADAMALLLRGDADCSDDGMAAALRARDPAAASGAPPMPRMALRLLRRMLAWQPAERPTPERCLRHAFFAAPTPGRGFACAGGHPDAEWEDECPTAGLAGEEAPGAP